MTDSPGASLAADADLLARFDLHRHAAQRAGRAAGVVEDDVREGDAAGFGPAVRRGGPGGLDRRLAVGFRGVEELDDLLEPGVMEESTLSYGLSYKPPYNPPNNKRT